MAKTLPPATLTFEQIIRKTGRDIPAKLLPADLIREIEPYWHEAAEDLLSPSPEVLSHLLKNLKTEHMDEAV